MDITLEMQVRSVYGTDRIYPMNEQARRLTDLLGRKTFTKDDLAKIKAMGFAVKWVPIALP
jgi:hypothetical protein